jgi:hypothetical protein
MTAANDPLDRVLRMVAEGRLTADEAAPIIDALQAKAAPRGASAPAEPGGSSGEPASRGDGRRPRYARIEVQEGGRSVVNLRVPISLGRLALARGPGLSADQIAEVEAAVASGAGGPILDVQDPDGDGVRIVLE